MKDIHITGTTFGRIAGMIFCIGVLAGPAAALAGIAFQYNPIGDTILSASFTMDFAAMRAHRTLGGYEMNYAFLVDCNGGGSLPDCSLSDALFGTSAFPDPPQVNMGALQTGWISADIAPSFFPALAGGSVGLRALLTDTDDAMFAIDFISLAVVTDGGTVTSYYGWPVGNENNGFGVDPPIADGGDLPSPLPGPISIGATGTGFDETISSKSILAIPEPGVLLLLLPAVLMMQRRPLRPVRPVEEP